MSEIARIHEGVSDVPTSPKAQALCDLLMSPYSAHMAALNEKTDRGEVLRGLAPNSLVGTLKQGLQLVLSQYGDALSPATTNLLAHWLREHAALAEKLNSSWESLSRTTIGELVRAVKVGFTAEESAIGAALGGAFGPTGRLVGGTIGGLFAFQRDNRDEETRGRAYLAEVTRWVVVMTSDFDRRVLLKIERDLNPWPYRLCAGAIGLLLVAALGSAVWFLR